MRTRPCEGDLAALKEQNVRDDVLEVRQRDVAVEDKAVCHVG